MNGMNGLQIVGPAPRPDVAYALARERARQQERTQRAIINTRADTSTACPSCRSSIYDSDYGYCPSCGFERTNNGHANQRSATPTHTPRPRCGMCGGTWGPNCCLFGVQAHGRA
jgi:hypothetical protein